MSPKVKTFAKNKRIESNLFFRTILLVFAVFFSTPPVWALHISDGVLPPSMITLSAVLCAVFTGLGLCAIDTDNIPKTGIMSSVFFVASFIFVPIPPSSAHLVLGGVIGLLLGWAAFPAILVAFVLQSLYGFGGITTLGANTINVALPAVICHYLFIPFVKRAKTQKVIFILGTMAGSFAVLLTTLMLCVTLHFSGESGEFDKAAMLLLGAHVPLMIAEGAITGFAVSFLDRVRPQLFGRQQYGEGV